MAHKKAQGAAKNLTDSNPQYLGTKLYDGQIAKSGSIIVRKLNFDGTTTTRKQVSVIEKK